ncbi:MAG: substrate-binding domain-containing protein [Desulfurivibrionaceae bacterium]
MIKKTFLLAAAALFTLCSVKPVVAARDYISVVGSSTVYPFATVVAERFGQITDYSTPKIESTGSGGGLKLFCQGVGDEHPDITNASRPIKDSEIKMCRENGVKEIVEVKIGYDGIVLANSRKAQTFKLSRREIFQALAKKVPAPGGDDKLVKNPYKNWQEIDPGLPDKKIEVYGPPPTSGTRDALLELVMEVGANTFPRIEKIEDEDKARWERICHTMREDDHFIEAGENDNLIVQKVDTNSNALGIFGYSFLDQNRDRIHGAVIEGVKPSFENISDESYPISRSLYFYVKKAHVEFIPGLKDYLRSWSQPATWGEEGVLSNRGLVPMPPAERKKMSRRINQLIPLSTKAD